MSRIFWDTNIFILSSGGLRPSVGARGFDAPENAGEGGPAAHLRVDGRGDYSEGTKEWDREVARLYEEAILATALVLPFGIGEARIFSMLRADAAPKVHPADAIHLACASIARTDVFVTNDKALHSMRVPRIGSITSVERALADG